MRRARLRADGRGGFTLIELLIVVAIIGILVSILIPVFQGAMQKAKQKTTMVDMGNIAKAITSYVTDMGAAPTSPEGNLQTDSDMFTQLTPFHYVTFTTRDQWGTWFQVWTGLSVAGHFGIEEGDVGRDDFLVQSLGRDGIDEGYSYDRSSPENNFYVLQTMDDFNKDLILWNGNWIRAPRHADQKQ
jgi:type II secretion system protein G